MITKAQLREASLLAGYPQGMSLQQLRSFASVLDMIRDRDDRIAAARVARVDLEAPLPARAYSAGWFSSSPRDRHARVKVDPEARTITSDEWDRARVTQTGTHVYVEIPPRDASGHRQCDVPDCSQCQKKAEEKRDDPDAQHRAILARELEQRWADAKELLGIECPCLPGAPKHEHGKGGYAPFEAPAEEKLTPASVARAFGVREEALLRSEENPSETDRDDVARTFVAGAVKRVEEKLQNLTGRDVHLPGVGVVKPGDTIVYRTSREFE